MNDELLLFQRNYVWTLVPKPEGKHIIGTKWIFRNKTDEGGNVIRNKTDEGGNVIRNKACLGSRIFSNGRSKL